MREIILGVGFVVGGMRQVVFGGSMEWIWGWWDRGGILGAEFGTDGMERII